MTASNLLGANTSAVSGAQSAGGAIGSAAAMLYSPVKVYILRPGKK